jgi:hypothetical protein
MTTERDLGRREIMNLLPKTPVRSSPVGDSHLHSHLSGQGNAWPCVNITDELDRSALITIISPFSIKPGIT